MNGVNSTFSVSTARRATYRIVAARSRSVLIAAHGASRSTYWLPMVESRMASARAALKRDWSISSPTLSKPASIAASVSLSDLVSAPGCGTVPKVRYAFVSVRLTRLPQFASSSSLLRRRNSAQVKSVSCVSGPAAVRKAALDEPRGCHLRPGRRWQPRGSSRAAFLTAAGPETQDTDFTWAEFLRRNNDELLANWGNLVNRTLTNAFRNFGEVPARGELTPRDRETLEAVEAGFESVGVLIEQARFKAALAEAMRLSSLGNQYVDHEAPWAVIKEDRDRAATILHVALRLVDTLKVIFTPFLPFSSQKLHHLLGYDGWLAGPLEFREVEEDGEKHTILTGDYGGWVGCWEATELQAGQKLREPEPLFRKLDPSIVNDELRRLDAA